MGESSLQFLTKFVTRPDGARLAAHCFRNNGSGSCSTIVLLHANGFSALCYTDMIQTLVGQFDVVGIDLRGHGSSSLGARKFSHAAVEDVLAVVDSLQLQDAFVFAHSIGATIALLAEQRRPGLWRGMYLYEPVVPGDPAEGHLNVQSGKALASVASKRARSFPSAQDAWRRLRTKPGFKDFTDGSLQAYIRHCMRTQLTGGEHHLRCTIEEEVFRSADDLCISASAHVHRLQCPVVLARGCADSADPDGPAESLLARCASKFATRCPHAVRHLFDGCEHFGPFTHPEQVAQHVFRALQPSEVTPYLWREHMRWLPPSTMISVGTRASTVGLQRSKL